MLFILNRDLEVVAVANNIGQTMPYYNDNHIQNLTAGTSSYEFTIPSSHPDAQFVIEGNYVVRTDLDGNKLMFTIMSIEDTHAGIPEKAIYCEDAGLELINEIDGPRTETTAHDIKYYINLAIQDAGWEIGYCDVANTRTLSYTDYDNSLARVLKIASDFDGVEISFSVEMSGSKVTHRYVNIHQHRGVDNGKRFTYSKDITSIKRKVDMAEVCTAMIGIGKSDSNNNTTLFTNQTYDDGDIYTVAGNNFVFSRSALGRWGQTGGNINRIFQYDTDNADELLTRTITQFKKQINPSVTYEMDVVMLERIAGYKEEKVRVGDTVKVADASFKPELYLEARVMELQISYTDPTKDKVTLGNYTLVKSNISAQLMAIQSTLMQKEATWSQVGDIITKADTAPTSPSFDSLWLDTSVTPNILKRYDGTNWVKATPTSANEVGAMSSTDGDNLTTNVNAIDERTTSGNMINTVVYSGDFTSIMNGKANVEDISDMATGQQVTDSYNNSVKYVDGRIDGDGGVTDQINEVSSSLNKRADGIDAKFSSTGGINLVKNSIGFAGTDLWAINGTVNTLQNQELEQLGFGSGFTSPQGTGGYIEQVINTQTGSTYSISLWLKKTVDNTTNGYAGVEVWENGVKLAFIGKDSGQGVTNGYELGVYTFTTQHNQITIRVTFGVNTNAIISGLMANIGQDALQWQHANGEVYNTTVQMNLNGVKVINGVTGGYTIMSDQEFSGYAPVNGTMTKVFTLNDDTTEVTKIQVDAEISMSPVKILPITSTNYTGWAFIPSS